MRKLWKWYRKHEKHNPMRPSTLSAQTLDASRRGSLSHLLSCRSLSGMFVEAEELKTTGLLSGQTIRHPTGRLAVVLILEPKEASRAARPQELL